MTALDTHRSPFDALRQVREDGTEFWSARDLAVAMQYDQWRNFSAAVERARVSAGNQGNAPEDHIADASKMVSVGSGAIREVDDFHLTRFGAYLTVMNGDPRKPEVAAAQAYFAVKTREAETQQPRELSRLELIDMMREAEVSRLAAESRAKELEAPATAWNELADSDGDYTVSDAAKILARAGISTGPRKLFDWLEARGWIFRRGGRWQAMQVAVNRGFLVERVTSTYIEDGTGQRVNGDPQVRITPKGLERLRELLGEARHLAVAK